MKDYLRYIRGARKYILMQHDINQAELELILWLRPLGKFSKEDLRVYEGILSWDTNRINTLINKGLVVKFRNALPNRHKALYDMSIKGKRICALLYKILETGVFPDNAACLHNKKRSTQAEKKYGHYYRKENALRKKEEIKKGSFNPPPLYLYYIFIMERMLLDHRLQSYDKKKREPKLSLPIGVPICFTHTQCVNSFYRRNAVRICCILF